jgi:DNA-binding Lrp family transcriptional regulator
MELELGDLKENQWKNRIDPADLFILALLAEGMTATDAEVASAVNERFGLSLSSSDVEARVGRMERERILLRRRTALVNPIKLYDFVFLVFLKLHLPSILERATVTWDVATEEILKLNRAYGSPVKVLFTVLGWGEYDLAGLVYVDDLEVYHRFQNALLEKGFIERYDSKTVHQGVAFHFDPVSVPDLDPSMERLRQYAGVLPWLARFKQEPSPNG